MKRSTTCRLRKVQCDECGCVCRMTRSWMERGLPTCGCGSRMMPTSPADLAFVGLVTSADMSQAAWNAICRENGWDLVRNQGQASRRLSEPVIHAPSKPQCSYAGCGRWVAAGAEYCHEHSPGAQGCHPVLVRNQLTIATEGTMRTPNDILQRVLGPRQVGGTYRSGYSKVAYRVLEIDDTNKLCPMLTVVDIDGPAPGRVRRHSTGWDRRDKVISQPSYGYCEDAEDERFNRTFDAAEFAEFCADPKRQALVERILRDI